MRRGCSEHVEAVTLSRHECVCMVGFNTGIAPKDACRHFAVSSVSASVSAPLVHFICAEGRGGSCSETTIVEFMFVPVLLSLGCPSLALGLALLVEDLEEGRGLVELGIHAIKGSLRSFALRSRV